MLFTQRAILATGHISGGCKDTLVGSVTSAFGRIAAMPINPHLGWLSNILISHFPPCGSMAVSKSIISRKFLWSSPST